MEVAYLKTAGEQKTYVEGKVGHDSIPCNTWAKIEMLGNL